MTAFASTRRDLNMSARFRLNGRNLNAPTDSAPTEKSVSNYDCILTQMCSKNTARPIQLVYQIICQKGTGYAYRR